MSSSRILIPSIIILALAIAMGSYAPQVGAARAFFVFGDSLVDNGNNNYLATTARADAPPYGIDFPTHQPTGRFSNGLNIPDLISQYIGSEFLLPYLSPQLTGNKLLVGANFASAGVGVLNDTGIQFVNVIRMVEQIEYFREYQRRLSALVGAQGAKRLVNQALVLITVGGNDFVNNYYLVPYSVRSRQYSLPDYVKFVISDYKKLLMKLYELGARRVLVTGTGPLGCVPAELAMRSTNGDCSTQLQKAAYLFNPQLTQMIAQLNTHYVSDIFIAANTGLPQSDFITNPQAYGFTTSKIACCGQGPYNGLGMCTPASNLCKNRDQYVFWDAFHPSERANKYIVQQILNGSPDYMFPMNLTTILALDSTT
ncbi:GDSL esterase/lipase At5g33370-like [Euphorbia lathyris]|uniref:GDSL esterase/lipase At5g33370-like n=1 Tax=Euphorbia lathyris TaxID=212925 RepID=UPI003313A897